MCAKVNGVNFNFKNDFKLNKNILEILQIYPYKKKKKKL